MHLQRQPGQSLLLGVCVKLQPRTRLSTPLQFDVLPRGIKSMSLESFRSEGGHISANPSTTYYEWYLDK